MAVLGEWGPRGELDPTELTARFLSDADIVVAEGYKGAELPRIEVYRSALHPRSLYDPSDPDADLFLAMVTDRTDPAVLPRGTLQPPSDPRRCPSPSRGFRGRGS